MGGSGSADASGLGLVGTLVNLLVAEKTVFPVPANGKPAETVIAPAVAPERPAA